KMVSGLTFIRSLIKGVPYPYQLKDVLRKGVEYEWKQAQEKAFKELKNYLISAPYCGIPISTEHFTYILTSISLGAVLGQRDEHKREYVISYASKRLT
ncbi:13288_t:CDS:2, partial [Gigaspora rosea]